MQHLRSALPLARQRLTFLAPHDHGALYLLWHILTYLAMHADSMICLHGSAR